MDGTQAGNTTRDPAARPDDHASHLAAVLRHLPAELHDAALFRVGEVSIYPEPNGAALLVPTSSTLGGDGRVWLSREHLADLAEIVAACHAAAGGAAGDRDAAAELMAKVADQLAEAGANATGLCVGAVSLLPNPDGALLVIADGRGRRWGAEASLDRGELAQLVGVLRAFAGTAGEAIRDAA